MRKFQLTTTTLVKWHMEYNAKYFGGALKLPVFTIKQRSANRLGQFRCKYHSRGVNGVGVSTYCEEIAISVYYDRDEMSFRETLLHEMIHQWQAETFGLVDHKDTFRRKAAQINRDGWNISRTTSITDNVAEGILPKAKRKVGKEVRIMIWVDGKNGKKCFCFATEKCSDEMMRRICNSKESLQRWSQLEVYNVVLDEKTAKTYSVNRKDLRYYFYDEYGKTVEHLFNGKTNIFNKPWWVTARCNAR